MRVFLKNMNRGIYIMANDTVIEQTKALLNSIRHFDKETPIILIPYDEKYQSVATTLKESYGVTLYEDVPFIEKLSTGIVKEFPDNFIPRPNQFRKQACWFGPFEEFLYIDTDIVVFEKIIDVLSYIKEKDFLCCDYQHKGGVRNVFTESAIKKNFIKQDDIKDIFNAGFWGGRRNAITEREILETASECAANLSCLDFSQKTSDMPIFNYMVIKKIAQKVNLTHLGSEPGSWAGMPHFIKNDSLLVDPNCNIPLRYIHWAGIKIQPGCPYWDAWKYYRDLKLRG